MYCPKCDMDFQDGVTVCSDCGSPLVDKNLYLKEKAEKAAALAEQEKAEYERRMAEAEALIAAAAADEGLQQKLRDEEERVYRRPKVYVKRADKYEDLRSSVSAFRIVGVLLCVFAFLLWTGIVKLPMNPVSGIIFRIAVTVMGIGALVISVKTAKDAEVVRGQIDEETRTTRQLIEWFTGTYSAADVDRAVVRENGRGLTPEEFALKRITYIQDMFVTQYDLADQGYADALAEEVYSRIYEGKAADDADEDEAFDDSPVSDGEDGGSTDEKGGAAD